MSEKRKYLSTPIPGYPYGKSITPEEAGEEIHLDIPKHLIPTGKNLGVPGELIVPNCIVIHTTTDNNKSAVDLYNFFSNPEANKRGVATQLAIGKEGDAIQMTNFFEKAVHRAYAVKNYPATISMELTDKGVYESRTDAPQAQFEKAIEITLFCMKQYNIPLGEHDSSWYSSSNERIENLPPGVYGHYQLNPETKVDPGEGFLRDIREELIHRIKAN